MLQWFRSREKDPEWKKSHRRRADDVCEWLEFIKQMRDAAWSAALERLCWQMVGAVAKEIVRASKISQQEAFDRATFMIVQRVHFDENRGPITHPSYQPSGYQIDLDARTPEEVADLDAESVGIQQLKERMKALKSTFYRRSRDWINPQPFIDELVKIVKPGIQRKTQSAGI